MPPAPFLLLKEANIDKNGYNIVKGVSAGCNPKTPNRIECSEINACNCPETKLSPVEWSRRCELPVEENYMMMRAEQRRRYKDRKYNGTLLTHSQYVLKQNHKDAYKNQSKDKLFVNPRPDTGNDISQKFSPVVLCSRRQTVSRN